MSRLAKVVTLHPQTVTDYSKAASRRRHPTAAPAAKVHPAIWAAAVAYAGGDTSRIVRVSYGHVIVT